MNFVTIEEAAKIFGVSKTTMYNKTRAGEFPHFRVGKSVRFDADELRKCFKTAALRKKGARN